MRTITTLHLVKFYFLKMVMRFFRPSLSSCSRLSVTGDTAKYLVLTLQRLCTFTLRPNQPKHPIHSDCVKERRRLRRDLSEEEFNHTCKTRPTYNSPTSASQADRLNPHNLVDQDRAHNVKRLHWKHLNLE